MVHEKVDSQILKMSPQWDLLRKIVGASEANLEVYSSRTRDSPNQIVLRDTESKAIFLPSRGSPREQYVDNSFRDDIERKFPSGWTRFSDNQRRFEQSLGLVAGKRVLDFGCGKGDFLRLASGLSARAEGVELNPLLRSNLTSQGFACHESLGAVEDGFFDTIFFFHVIEHLDDPISILRQAMQKLAPGGHIVVEVPSSEALLMELSEGYRQHSLWSQHLILHSRKSIEALLEHAGFTQIQVRGVQRYPLSNLLGWASRNASGGHLGPLSQLDSPLLNSALEASLASIGRTDTLLALAVSTHIGSDS